ncbi:MAG: AMP-dependent synthetase/ligase [Gemmatimonadaceae bacterium]
MKAAATLPALLRERAAQRPDALSLRHKKFGRWREYAWSEYADHAARAGLGLRAIGVKPGERVAIHSENRPEWLFADLGAQGIGAAVVGVYPTSPADEVEYLLHHSESVVLIAEDEEQLDKTLAVRARLPNLRHIVVIETRGIAHRLTDPMILTYAELERHGEQHNVDEYAASIAALDPQSLAILVYTSGTTGPPKGAMLSHANLMTAGAAFLNVFTPKEGDETLSYLPLCHIAERLFSLGWALPAGIVVNFGDGTESLLTDLRIVQPHIFFGVPRVWEKMLANVSIKMADASRLKRTLYAFWLRQGQRLGRQRLAGHELSLWDRLLYALGWICIFRPLRERLGLVRVREACSGSAPIAPQVLEFFWALGVRIRELYGMTENVAVCTYTPHEDVRIGKVGTPHAGVDIRISADGEIVMRGPAIFMGYFKNEQATRDTIDEDGWLHTGDVGELDSDGYLTITDRKKDILITSGGKNISPSWIENKLKVSPYVRESIVIGDRRKYVTALIGIELDTVGDWATRRGIPFTTYRDLSEKPEVRSLIDGWIAEVNGTLSNVEQVKRFALLPKELDHEDGQLTATQKVRRRAISAEFADMIEALYR